MDTITHGIAGALISKAVFRGGDLVTKRPMSHARIITFATMIGAIFPDSDVFRQLFSRDELLMVTWHRSLTHSLLCLPAFALGLAALTQWYARRRKWECPSFGMLTLVYAVGILSHILLDLLNNFGTMIWTPLSWSRTAWDLIFIVDLTLSAILLLPQVLAWVYERGEGVARRALQAWLGCVLAVMVITGVSQRLFVHISALTALGVATFLAALIFGPLVGGRGLRISRAAWCRAGLVVLAVYLGTAAVAHRTALERVRQFAALEHLEVRSIAALPLPPSVLQWDGLIRAPRGVYELRMDLSKREPEAAERDGVLEYSFYPEAQANPQIEEARGLPAVQKLFSFARFPVTRFRKEGSAAVIEFLDLRFRSPIPGRPSPFTYRVRLDSGGRVVSQGWVRR